MSNTGVIYKIIISLFILNNINCAKILEIFIVPSKSLHLSGINMAEILIEKGHDVTLISPYKMNEDVNKTIKHVFLNDIFKVTQSTLANLFDLDQNIYQQMYLFSKFSIHFCDLAFNDPNFKKFLEKKEKFDLIILNVDYSESMIYMGEYFNAPVMLYTSTHLSTWVNSIVGNPLPPSYVPYILSDYTSDMTFFQRLDNAFLYLVDEMVKNFCTFPGHGEIVKKNFPNSPNFYEYFHKPSVLLVNDDVSVSDSVPLVPGIVHVGGFHIRPVKKLPGDLQEILDNAKNGVIYFSMGSNIKSSQMSNKTLTSILNVFSKLKQTIIWKWENEELPGKPKNVVVRKWLPQNDILAHKNVKLFITHGGYHSIIETTYYGVPCVSLPVYLDQITNSKAATKLGYAEWINYKDLTEENFDKTLDQVLNNPKYLKTVKERSAILKDKPMTQADSLEYWINYVINHKGAEHLKLASLKLNWFQYLLLDVIGFVLLIFVLFIILVKFIVKKLSNSSQLKQKTM